MNNTNTDHLVNNAIRSLYQLIMLINTDSLSCRMIDYNNELHNISPEIDAFDKFFDKLYNNIHPVERASFRAFADPEKFIAVLSQKVYTSMECRIRHNDHKYYWSKLIMCNATEEDVAGGKDFLFLIEDIHDWKKKELEDEAEQRALLKVMQDKYDLIFHENMIDQQTGCYNRKGLKYHADMIIEKAKKEDLYLFVCVADLNGLKYMNDTYGHAAGDEAIAAVSSVLSKAAPKGSCIVRTGGDEFLIFAALDKDSKEPKEMEPKIEEGLKAYNQLHSNPFEIGASYGWMLLPAKEDLVNLDEYIEIADSKMYEMKKVKDRYRR